MAARARLKGLYLIAGSGLDVATARSWLSPGVALVQYRNKTADRHTRLKEATRLCRLCKERGVALVVNDDAELAIAVGADGVHLGKTDLRVSRARALFGRKLIVGASCYNSIDRALSAQHDGADYVAFGALFASRTKPEATGITLAQLTAYKQRLAIPVCAIGGVTLGNLGLALNTGADLVAVHAAIAHAADPRAAVQRFIEAISRRA